ncbi:MAG: substrate-binding domain-containing protein [Burkholderiaceae bacterium]|nr:substrate-binding domain-containing protein [Burkholderiaceae bacterium]
MPNTLRLFVPAAIRAVMVRLAPRIEAATEVRLIQEVELNPLIPARIRAGEPYDIGLTNPPYAKTLIEDGFADSGSNRAFGRVPLAVARRGEAQGQIVADSMGIETLLRSAKSIVYTGAGTSGRTYLGAIERMGLTDSVLPRSHPMAGGVPAASVATGEYELAIAPLTTVLATPGVVPAAVFPEYLGTHIDMSVFRSTTSPDVASTVIEFLIGHHLDDELAAAGIARFALD